MFYLLRMDVSFNKFNNISFASRKVQKTNPQGETFYIENGNAFDLKGKPYSGTLQARNKHGDEFLLCYENGKIKTSEKNGKLYKSYYYNSDDGGRYHCFKDNSVLTYQHLYHIYEDDIVQIRNYENKTRHYIMRNDKNGFQNEPKVFCHVTAELRSKKKLDAKTIPLNNIKNVDFASIDEAKSYFLEKYGINANFKDLKTAHILKQAVDVFTPFNYKGKGEKLFEGLRVENDALENNVWGKMIYRYELNGERINENTATQKEVDEFNEKVKRHIEDNSKDIKVADYYIDITSLPIAPTILRRCYNNGFHSTQFISSIVVHELIHYLHASENPNWYALNAKKVLTNEQLALAKEVGDYSCIDPAEFVAEYATGRLEGKTFSKEADELYKEFKGPDLFS